MTSFAEAAERFGCGQGCGNCAPYIEQMLLTGETEFAILSLDRPISAIT